MNNIELKAYRAKEISFVNKVENNTKINFENKYSYNVNYSRQNICKGEMKVSAISKEFPDKFNITVVVEGIFGFDPEVPKEKIHVESFKQLFPYTKALISTVTANAGIPALFIPTIDIEKSSIYKYDVNNSFINPNKRRENEEDEENDDE
ncbi:MAG: protein-export chaperone SecB [Clostridia bacterium]|jgi:preprotein translocase subunit SecB|nr:protein-export chaperone SecB [Clostridia bacterium]MBQ4245247.1 protein-export chaperone SecB [Clostridia bacterium]